MPSKGEADEVANMIASAKDRLNEFMERQSALGALEQEVLKQNNNVDESLVWVTVLESVGILALAVAEMFILSRFISKKELF